LRWDFRANSLFRLLANKRNAGTEILDLTESNPTRAGFLYDSSEIVAAVSDAGVLSYEPHAAGKRAAREAVAAYYSCRGQAVDPDNVVLTAGTSEAYGYLFKLLADPGNEVLAPRPSYPLFEYLAGLEAVSVSHYPLVLDRTWGMDIEGLRASVGARTKAVVVVSPNNPTGNFLRPAELEMLIGLDRAIICDEVFSDFVLEERVGGAATTNVEGGLCFTLNGLSKVVGLPQMKLAWIVVSGPEGARQQALERLELICDTYLSVGTPVQSGAARLLETRGSFQTQVLSRLRENLSLLRKEVAAQPACTLLPVEAGWYAILRLPQTASEEEWALAFLELDNVLVQPGYFYDFHAGVHIVVSLLTPPDIIGEGIRRLLARVGTMLSG
jgi:aspartate/methionine/tyrosine aminotransferase